MSFDANKSAFMMTILPQTLPERSQDTPIKGNAPVSPAELSVGK
jgi:hypothetical protein